MVDFPSNETLIGDVGFVVYSALVDVTFAAKIAVLILGFVVGSLAMLYVVCCGLICVFSFNRNPFRFMHNLFKNFVSFNFILSQMIIDLLTLAFSGLQVFASGLGSALTAILKRGGL